MYQLTPRQKVVLDLRLQGLTYERIAASLGTTADAARKHAVAAYAVIGQLAISQNPNIIKHVQPGV